MGLFGSSDAAEIADLRRRVAVLEAQLAAVARQAGVDLRSVATPPGVSSRARQLWSAGRTIEAIKVHREEHGLSLAQAKADVDALGPRGR